MDVITSLFVMRTCLLAVLCLLALGSQRDGSFLHTRTASELIFRQSWGVRAFFPLVIAYGVLAGGVALLHRMPLPLLLASGAVFAVLLRGFGPNQITFDIGKQSYYFITRWFWSARVRKGSWNDFAGVRVRYSSTRGTSSYTVDIACKCGLDFRPVLGRFSKRERAEAFASELSQTLALPCVELPSSRKEKLLFSDNK